MENTSIRDQSTGGPELVEILKRLGAHRRKAYDQTYGPLKLHSKLDKIADTLLESLQDHDFHAAGKALCRFVDIAGVTCCEEARMRMLENLDAFMGTRLASLASGATSFEASFAALGPEAEAAFDLWDRIGKSPPIPEERDAYWQHPLLVVCRWLEDRSGIKRDDFEAAAFRLNTPLGLRSMEPLPAPDGVTVYNKGVSDMLWMIPRFRELDQDGTTARLWQLLMEKYQAILEEVGLLTDACDDMRKSPPIESQAVTPPPTPKKHLVNWRDILIFLEMKSNDEDKQKVVRLNETYNGPIIKPGQGKQPFVERDKLLEWWNGLEEMVQSQANQARDTKETVKGRHAYGREGEVVPEISGSVKRRRKDRKP